MALLVLMYLPGTSENKKQLQLLWLTTFRFPPCMVTVFFSQLCFSSVFTGLCTDKQNQPHWIELSQFVPLLK